VIESLNIPSLLPLLSNPHLILDLGLVSFFFDLRLGINIGCGDGRWLRAICNQLSHVL